MRTRTTFVTRFLKDQRGQDLVDYAVMAAFVALAAGAIMPGVSGTTIRIICSILAIVALGFIVLRRKKSADDY